MLVWTHCGKQAWGVAGRIPWNTLRLTWIISTYWILLDLDYSDVFHGAASPGCSICSGPIFISALQSFTLVSNSIFSSQTDAFHIPPGLKNEQVCHVNEHWDLKPRSMIDFTGVDNFTPCGKNLDPLPQHPSN